MRGVNQSHISQMAQHREMRNNSVLTVTNNKNVGIVGGT